MDLNNMEAHEFLDNVRRARDEWLNAQNYFENVTEPDLIDYAIYRIETARRKYMYLVKQARIKGIEDKRFIHEMDL